MKNIAPTAEALHDVPPGLIFLFGELTQKVDGISSSINEIKARSESFEARTIDLITREIEQIKKEIDREVEIVHRRISEARNRTIQVSLIFATLMSGVVALVAGLIR